MHINCEIKCFILHDIRNFLSKCVFNLFVSFFFSHLSGLSSAGSVGREFALVFMQNNFRSQRPLNELYITAVQDNDDLMVRVPSLNFKLEMAKGRKKVKAGQRVIIKLPPRVMMYGNSVSRSTVLIEASADVAVTSVSRLGKTAEMSLVYPTTEWGTEYFIFTPHITSNINEFAVTNGKQRNKLTIFPKGLIKYGNRIYKRGSRMVIFVHPYQSLQLQSRQDLSGTRIVSRYPVAVFTGYTCTRRQCSHVSEQLLPVSKWGSSFIVPPLGLGSQYDSVFIQASKFTRVKVQILKRKFRRTLRVGQTVQFRFKKGETVTIKATQGIQVLLFRVVKKYSPFLMTILPTRRFCSSYLVESFKDFRSRIMIVARTSAMAKIRYDGLRLRNVQWKKVPGTDFSYTHYTISKRWFSLLNWFKKRHTISSPGSQFALYNTGQGYRNGYGYGAPGECIQPGKVNTLSLNITHELNLYKVGVD